MRIREVYIIGTGVLASSCAKYVKQQGLSVYLYDMGRVPSKTMEIQAKREDVQYFHKDPEEVFRYLCEIEEEILLVSAINEWIVPAKLLCKKNITAINLHQALLPAHPGRNAEAWAIFEQDTKAGITWHMMENKVDKGDILIQKEIILCDTITAFQLFRMQIERAYEAFEEILMPLILGECIGKQQSNDKKGEFHFNKDVPGDGWLNTAWTGKKISAFLRSIDYGVLQIWSPPKIRLEQGVFQWKKYEIMKCEYKEEQIKIIEEEQKGKMVKNIYLYKKDMKIILKNIEKLEE